MLTRVLPFLAPNAAKKIASCFPRVQCVLFIHGLLTYGLVIKETEDKMLTFARECPLLRLIEVNGLWCRKWAKMTDDEPTEVEEATMLASKFEAERKAFEKKLRTKHNIIMMNSIHQNLSW